MEERVNDPNMDGDEREFDPTLRPTSFDDLLGQQKVKDQLRIAIQAAKQRDEALDHVLLHGPPGLGKTTISYVIAQELEVQVHPTSGPLLERPGDLAGILTTLGSHDVLFIDEIHRVNKVVEEYLYSAMEDFRIDIMIDQGPQARSVSIPLEPFTLVGATTRQGLLTAPMRSRFGLHCLVDYYQLDELSEIAQRDARLLKFELNHEGAMEIARRSRGTARLAKRLLRRARDYAQVKEDGRVDGQTVSKALDMLNVDEMGLDEIDMKLLISLIDKFAGGPVGISNLAAAIGEGAETIEEVYEPYLIKEGFLKRTSRGRQAMPKAYQHLGRTLPDIGGDGPQLSMI
jgi:Holliday junction DNA helicase RuvB